MNAPDGTVSRGVALYDPSTGRIAHIQRILILPGGPDLTSEQVVERAHVHARRGGHEVSRLQAVHLADDHDYRTTHVVDLTTGAVVAAPKPSRGSSAR